MSLPISNRNIPLDLLRSLSIFGVILIHTFLHFTRTRFAYPHQDFLLDEIWRFAVPFFLIISGLFSDKIKNTPLLPFLRKITLKLILPYLFFSLVLYTFFTHTEKTTSLLTNLLTGSTDYQLWFIPLIILFYLIYHLTSRPSSPTTLIWTILSIISLSLCLFATFPTQTLQPILKLFLTPHQANSFAKYLLITLPFSISPLYFFFHFFAFGLLLKKYHTTLFIHQRTSTLITSLIILFTLTPFYLIYANQNLSLYFPYEDIFLTLFSLSLFPPLYLSLTKLNNLPHLKKTLYHLSLPGKNSLYIFLSHTLFLRLLTPLYPTSPLSNIYLHTYLFAFLILLLSHSTFLLISHLIQYLPHLIRRIHSHQTIS